jgi:hypothetical protein
MFEDICKIYKNFMNKDFAPFEVAVKLKEKGFPQDGFIGYDEFGTLCIGDEHSIVCASPTIPQVFKWLREEKGIHIEPIVTTTFATKNNTAYFVLIKHKITATSMDSIDLLETYALFDDACIAGIEYVLDNLI